MDDTRSAAELIEARTRRLQDVSGPFVFLREARFLGVDYQRGDAVQAGQVDAGTIANLFRERIIGYAAELDGQPRELNDEGSIRAALQQAINQQTAGSSMAPESSEPGNSTGDGSGEGSGPGEGEGTGEGTGEGEGEGTGERGTGEEDEGDEGESDRILDNDPPPNVPVAPSVAARKGKRRQ